MDRNDTADINVWQIPVTDTSYLQVANSVGVANRLTSLLGPARNQDGEDPICVIDAGESSRDGIIVDFENFGPGCRLGCGPNTTAQDLLPWINLLLPAAQIIPMHASAFTWKGEGVVVTGSAGSGKTGALLAAIHQGAGAVGDECLWLYRNARLRGVLVNMEIRADYFREMPYLRSEISPFARYGLLICDFLGRSSRPILPKLSRKFVGKARARVQPDIVRRHLAPSATIGRLFLSRIRPDAGFRVYPVELSEVIPELVDIQFLEFARQYEYYTLYRDTPKSRQNEWMDGFRQRLEKLLGDALRKTKIYIVEHPASPRAQDLFSAIAATFP